jgi:Secretion system C-terminal sorting domain
MKPLFTIAFFLLLANFATAQVSNLQIASLKVEMAVKSTDLDIAGDNLVKSLSTITTNWQWERTVVGLPTTWKTQVCDPQLCWSAAVGSGTFELLAGQEFDLAVHARPQGTDGSGIVYIKLTEIGTLNTVTIEYNINNYSSSSTDNLNDFSAINIFPNPVRDHFSLENVPTSIQSIRIMNLQGRRLCQYKMTPDMRFELPEFEAGSYLLMFEDEKMQVRKTMIINKL